MTSLIGASLNELGLYRPLRRALNYLKDPKRRVREREVRDDLEQTRREVGKWAAEGRELADPDRLFAIVSFTNLPLHAKFHCLIAKAMQLQGYTPVVFTFSGCRFAHEYFRMFGVDRYVMWDDYARQTVPDENVVREIVSHLLPKSPSVNEVKDCRFHGVDVGKHALSMTCRRRIEGSLDLGDTQTKELLETEFANAVRGVLVAERFFEENPVKKILVRDAGYIPNGGIYETALEKGIDCVVYEQGQRLHTWIFKRYTRDSKGEHYFSLDRSTWEEVKRQPWGAEQESRLKGEFAGRYKPDSADDTRRLQSGKQLKPPDEVQSQLGLDPARKTAVIFSHIAWDAAFFFGTCLFDDFEDWLYETVKFVASECPEMNWIVKLHPFNVFKLQRENRTEESEIRLLRTLMPLPDHVKIMRADCDINTQSLFPVIDFALTVNGTVGMEFPCMGIPSIVAGTGRYDGRGFTVDPQTREEYFSELKKLHTRRPLDPEARELACRHFLALTVGRQTSLEDIAPMALKRINEGQSDVHDNIRISPRSLEEFKNSQSTVRLMKWLGEEESPDLLIP